MLNYSQVSKQNLYLTFSIELYCILSFFDYIYSELVTPWPFVMRKLYERCYRKFGYEWTIMTLSPKKKKLHRTHWNTCDETSFYYWDAINLFYLCISLISYEKLTFRTWYTFSLKFIWTNNKFYKRIHISFKLISSGFK